MRPRLAQKRLSAHRSNTPAPLVVGRPACIQARIASVGDVDGPVRSMRRPRRTHAHSPSYDPARVPRRSVKFTFEGGYLSAP
ncbi:hypothetical protein EW146_g8244 [Bondarzewia mesenterica]|uniref:Uncharacterized protein n=1 Tax=Bondarzewia mesenterica TaxID=1095465 RepID=A0A4V3XDS1_9AGAM|nr:hypothetical protein EW146_g8244 [Bondarzewia mesenterica]